MVKEVNATTVDPTEQLTDNVMNFASFILKSPVSHIPFR